MTRIEKIRYIKEQRELRTPLEEIGKFLGVSKQYIHQLVNKYGIGKPPLPAKVKKVTDYKEKLISKVEVLPSGCWEWRGAKSPKGYGRMSYKGEAQYTHRISYEVHKGPIEEGLCVCHSCDNPICVNPEHLWTGTHLENIQDRDAKGRHKKRGKK